MRTYNVNGRVQNLQPSNGVAVTPGDDTAVEYYGLFIGNTGDVSVVFLDDASNTPVVFENIANGTVLDIQVKRVRATGTTATGIVGYTKN